MSEFIGNGFLGAIFFGMIGYYLHGDFMMKKYNFLVLFLGVLGWSISTAQETIQEKVIYKWNRDGLVHYSHIKPAAIDDFVKLDNTGRRIEEVSEDFGEIVEVVVRPKKASMDEKTGEILVTEPQKETQGQTIRQQNCEASQGNLATLQRGEIYEKDEQGNMMPLSPEKIESKRKKFQKDIEYYCN